MSDSSAAGAAPLTKAAEARPAAHTPGPWVPSKFGTQVLTGDGWSTICVLEGAAQWEDGRGSYAQQYGWENQEANARLIAAAPEMFRLLAGVLPLVEWAATAVDPIFRPKAERTAESIRAAISLATTTTREDT